MHTNANRGLCDDYCASCNETKRYVGDEQEYSRVLGVEYQGGYDGISEWRCPDCGRREGRWSGKVLGKGETEPRYGGQS
jgi:hypothetical protein